MSIASEPKLCPKCGTTIPAEAPQGLCPACLLHEISQPTDAGHNSRERPVPPSLSELAPAFPQLEILELIGQGGMGFVFKARQPKLDRFVALKILPQSLAADPAFAERFTREGRLLARLNHPNIVTVHDFGVASGILPDVEPGFQPGGKSVDKKENEKISNASVNTSPDSRGKMQRSTSGRMPDATFFYLLMEYVDGVNLRQAMKAGRFTAEQALAVVPKICEALQFAHNEGILHRDIKPENILLDTKGRVKIADFGIAKLIGEAGGRAELPLDQNIKAAKQHIPAADLTHAGKTLGTPNYMAPEQIATPGSVDHRADIYSLGVVFYEMLTGELPIGRFAPPSQKSAADPRLDDVVRRALEKEPNRRTQSAGEVKTQVETIATHQPPRVEGSPRPRVKETGFLKRGLTIGVLVFFAVVLFAAFSSFLLPATYEAIARIKVEKTVQPSDYDPYWLLTQVEIVESKAVLSAVVRDLSLEKRWLARFGGTKPTPSEILEVLKQSLSIRQIRNTSLIEVHYFSENPNEAAAIANAIAETYLALSHRDSPGIKIVDSATPASRPVRAIKSKILNGLLGGVVLGVLAGLITVLILRIKRPPENPASSASADPGHFWKRYAVIAGLVLLALILIPVLARVLGLAWPAYQRAQSRAQEVRAQVKEQAINAAEINSTSGASVVIPSRLEFRLAPYENDAAPSDEFLDRVDQAGGGKLRVRKAVLMDDSFIGGAQVAKNPVDGREEILVFLTAAGKERFSKLTKENTGQQIAFVFDQTVLRAPRIAGEIKSGSLQIAGNFPAEEMERIVFALNAPKPEADGAHSSLPGFASPIERILFSDSSAGKYSGLDLDTGRLFEIPVHFIANQTKRTEKETTAINQWIKTNSINLLPNLALSELGVIGINLDSVVTPSESWVDLPAHLVAQQLGVARPNGKLLIPGTGQFPATYLFKTTDGSSGILQILGIVTQPNGVKIRYKLVQTEKK